MPTRRQVLRSAVGVGIVASAGCLGDSGGEATPTPTPTATPTPTPEPTPTPRDVTALPVVLFDHALTETHTETVEIPGEVKVVIPDTLPSGLAPLVDIDLGMWRYRGDELPVVTSLPAGTHDLTVSTRDDPIDATVRIEAYAPADIHPLEFHGADPIWTTVDALPTTYNDQTTTGSVDRAIELQVDAEVTVSVDHDGNGIVAWSYYDADAMDWRYHDGAEWWKPSEYAHEYDGDEAVTWTLPGGYTYWFTAANVESVTTRFAD